MKTLSHGRVDLWVGVFLIIIHKHENFKSFLNHKS